MDAKAKSFTFLSNEGQVTIPFFQRGYVWDEDNWSDLLTDLLNSTKSHFLGSLILKQQRSTTGEPKNVTVIDGQQRLTTLSILLKALFDTFPESIREHTTIPLRNHLFFKQYQTDAEYRVRIKHSHADEQAYTTVIRANLEGPGIDADADATNRIVQCYNYFCRQLRARSDDERKRLFNRLLDQDQRMLVVIDLTEEDDEQTIFDTTNTSGVRLSCADIIKNALFQRAIQLLAGKPDEAVALYQRTWAHVFLSDDDAVAYWETKRLTGRLQRDNIEVLLHSIAVIKGFYDPDKHQLSDLSKLYKEQIAKLSTLNEAVAFVKEIHHYGELYRENILSFDDSTAFSYADYRQRLFHILDVLQVSTFHPFILFAIKEFKNDAAKCERILSSLERFVMRRMLAKQETKNYNKICKDFINNPDSVIAEANNTKDEEVSNGLTAIANKNAALVLFWVELLRRSQDRKYDGTELKFDYSLEHIMPQKWEEHWKNIPMKHDAAGNIMEQQEAKKDRYDKVYWLGNMTLLTSSLNSALRNYAFQKKMSGDGRKKGVKSYASLSVTKDDIVAPYESGDMEWDENKIIARTAALGKEVSQLWGTVE